MSEFDKVFFLRVATFEMTQASIKHIASHRFVTEVGINPAPFSAEQKSLLNKLRSDLAVAEGGYRKLAEILVLMQREAPIDVIELPSAEVEDV
ncbi:hypothetical protein ACFFON_17090, partial [Arthrobacter citreus]|uniref:hypothetical protein n=1 Tax=Arthrobacter citreus TaxID=1670 RepID=UPI0035EFDFC2